MRGRGDWGGLLEGLAVIVSCEGERGLGWPAGGVGSHCELERGEGALNMFFPSKFNKQPNM